MAIQQQSKLLPKPFNILLPKNVFILEIFIKKSIFFLPIHQDYHRKRDVRQRQFERRRAAGRFGHRRAHQPRQRIDFNPDKIKGGLTERRPLFIFRKDRRNEASPGS